MADYVTTTSTRLRKLSMDLPVFDGHMEARLLLVRAATHIERLLKVIGEVQCDLKDALEYDEEANPTYTSRSSADIKTPTGEDQ